jgi:hypothetical protein
MDDEDQMWAPFARQYTERVLDVPIGRGKQDAEGLVAFDFKSANEVNGGLNNALFVQTKLQQQAIRFDGNERVMPEVFRSGFNPKSQLFGSERRPPRISRGKRKLSQIQSVFNDDNGNRERLSSGIHKDKLEQMSFQAYKRAKREDVSFKIEPSMQGVITQNQFHARQNPLNNDLIDRSHNVQPLKRDDVPAQGLNVHRQLGQQPLNAMSLKEPWRRNVNYNPFQNGNSYF